MNSIKDHSVRVIATCKHCGSELHDEFLSSPNRRYIERAFEAMKRGARKMFPSPKDVRIKETLDLKS